MWMKWMPIAALWLAACDPYTRFVGDSSAGAVDPRNFPTAYRGIDPNSGAPPDSKMPGSGMLTPTAALLGGDQVGYYAFPFAGNDLSLSIEGKLIIPLAYDFDEDGMTKCVAPENYVFDQQRDDVHYDVQGDIFVRLPDAPGYLPVVADVKVASNGLPCQDVKSETTVVERSDVTLETVPAEHPNQPNAHPTGKPSGVYYARPIIDPSLDVRAPVGMFGYAPDGTPYTVDPNTGLGPQRWGWYQRYLLAYLDGGLIPTLAKDVTNKGGQAQHVIEMISQPIYFPSRHPGLDDQGNKVPVDGALGEGFDVLTAKRGAAMFSPLCEVYSFIPLDEMSPETDVKDIDMSTAQPTGEYVWCIQVTK